MRASKPERFTFKSGGQSYCGLRCDIVHDVGETRCIMVAVREQDAHMLSCREDVFLPTLGLYALVCGEDIDFDSARLGAVIERNIRYAIKQYRAWYPKYREPRFLNWVEDRSYRRPEAGMAAFYSGGIDSLFTLLRHSRDFADEPSRVDRRDVEFALHLMYFDDLDEVADLNSSVDVLKAPVIQMGAKFIPVFTNIYKFDRRQENSYRLVTHGAALASVAHALSASVGCALIASSQTYGGPLPFPYGSTLEVDPLFSSGEMTFIHDGATFTRVEKTELICRSDAALAAVNVCDQLVAGEGYRNCSNCHKCIRTMTTIDLCGKAGDACPSFDWSQYASDKFAKFILRRKGIGNETDFAHELVEAAKGRRPDIERAARKAISLSTWVAPVLFLEDGLRRSGFAMRHKEALKRARTGFLSAIGLHR